MECNVSQVDCKLNCKFSDPITYAPPELLFKTSQFWIFIALLSMGSIGFNVVNSATDAICFNILGTVTNWICLKSEKLFTTFCVWIFFNFNKVVIESYFKFVNFFLGEGNEDQYGSQRLWGTVGYGITAFFAGYLIDYVSKETTSKNNTPAFVLLMFFISLDIIVCSRLKVIKEILF